MLLTGRFIITKQYKQTKARFFSDLKVGDVFGVTYSLRHTTTRSTGTNRATCLTVENKDCSKMDIYTQSELYNILDRCFEIEEYTEGEN